MQASSQGIRFPLCQIFSVFSMAMGAPNKELGLQAGQGTQQITCNYTRTHGMQSRVFRMENVRGNDKKRQSRRITLDGTGRGGAKRPTMRKGSVMVSKPKPSFLVALFVPLWLRSCLFGRTH